MATTTLRVREPRELLALLPYQLGFEPNESAVAVSLRGPRGRVGLVARVDLADLGDLENGPQLARGLVSHLVADGARHGVLVVYTQEDPRQSLSSLGTAARDVRSSPVRAALVRAAAEQFRDAADPFLGDVTVWLVAASGYLSLDCVDRSCCPPGGRPLRDLESTVVGAHMVYAGERIQDNREDLGRIQPAPAADRRNAVRVANRARIRRTTAEAGGPAELAAWRADGLAAWRAAIEDGQTSSVSAPPAVLGRIEAALSDVQVRDAVLFALVPGSGDLPERSLAPGSGGVREPFTAGTTEALDRVLDPARGVPPDAALAAAAVSLLESVVAHSPAARQAPALALLALVAWWGGDGARSGVLLDRALDADQGHRLALLLADVVAGGLTPGWVRRRS